MKTLANFRDIGHVLTNDNRTVVSGQFLRSGEVVSLSNEDKETLAKTYGVKWIVDFRSEDEVSEKPDDDIQGARYVSIDILGDVGNQGSSMADFIATDYNPETMMLTIYEELVTSKSAQKGYSEFLNLIMDYPNEPVLFHCFAGKDRTGFGAALILASLDVPMDTIVHDYLATNESRKEVNKELLKEMASQGVSTGKLEDMNTMLTVNDMYLKHAFDTIDKEYGSFESYVTNILGMKHTFFEDMKARYTY